MKLELTYKVDRLVLFQVLNLGTKLVFSNRSLLLKSGALLSPLGQLTLDVLVGRLKALKVTDSAVEPGFMNKYSLRHCIDGFQMLI